MKKLFLSIGLALMCLAGYSQEIPHLEFEGIPVTGSVDNMVLQLKSKGYKQIKESSSLTGKVMGQKAKITVASTPDGSKVYLVLVECITKKSWEQVKTCYDSMRMQLVARYGDPILYKEEYDSPLAEADPLQALQYGNCTFISHYQAPGGEIILTITKDAVVQLYFVDTSNAVSLY